MGIRMLQLMCRGRTIGCDSAPNGLRFNRAALIDRNNVRLFLDAKIAAAFSTVLSLRIDAVRHDRVDHTADCQHERCGPE